MSNETQQETWNATHAQLLKSVADAQARLLAGINEVSDRLPTKLFAELASIEATLRGLKLRLDTLDLQFIANQNTMLSGKLDAIGAVLAEILDPKRPIYRASRKRRPAKRHR